MASAIEFECESGSCEELSASSDSNDDAKDPPCGDSVSISSESSSGSSSPSSGSDSGWKLRRHLLRSRRNDTLNTPGEAQANVCSSCPFFLIFFVDLYPTQQLGLYHFFLHFL